MDTETTEGFSTAVEVETLPVIDHLVTLGRSIGFKALPPSVVERVKCSFLDWCGAAFAGMGTSAAEIIRKVILQSAGEGDSGIIGGSFPTAGPVDAALINGTTAHALDFDDGIEAAEIVFGLAFHPSVSIVTAALAASQAEDACGERFVEAVVCGQETVARVAGLLGVEHHRAGWHATGTVGSFGSAAAAGKLLGLSDEQWAMALGIAGTQSAGLRAVFGTMSKPFHGGKAASNGVLASLLAREGFTSTPDVFGSRYGFAATHSSRQHAERALRPLGPPYFAEMVNFKMHASCGGTHCSIEAMTKLRLENHFTADEVDRIIVRVPLPRTTSCNIANPMTALEGKFSLRYTTAAALLGWDTSGGCFVDEAVCDPRARAVMDRTTVEGIDLPSVAGPTTVEVFLIDGRMFSCTLDDHDRGGPSDWRGLTDKFLRLATPAIGDKRAARVVETIEGLESLESMRIFHRLLSD